MNTNKVSIHIDLKKQRIPVSPVLYGIFFEEISRSGDGGIYAELIQNRSFEDSILPARCTYENGLLTSPTGWKCSFITPNSIPGWSLVKSEKAQVGMFLDPEEIIHEAHPLSLRLEINETDNQRVGVSNEGFWGIPVKQGEQYRLSFYFKKSENFARELLVSLEGEEGAVYAQECILVDSDGWHSYETVLESNSEDANAKLVLSTRNTGTVWLDLVSLFPVNTWRGQKNGFRTDLIKMIEEMKPGFLRFPGGCFVEGFSVETASRWKKTIGDLSERHGQWSLWSYRTTNGIGYHEYLQLAEDLGMEMMFVVNCGMTCQGRCGELIPMEELDEWLQDALDAVEYANGPITSPWGALRAKNGHPEPFHMKYLEIGNENWGPEYDKRYKVFYEALKKAYPELILISDSHTELSGLPTEIVDEHFYPDPAFFISNHDLYDAYDRNGPKVYVGEYAEIVQSGSGNLMSALSEAAFMTGMERNQDIVVMSSYAPLFANVHHTVWKPDAIYFDNTRVIGTPSYYVQKMFGQNRGDEVLAATLHTEYISQPLSGGLGLVADSNPASFRNMMIQKGETVLFDAREQDGQVDSKFIGEKDWKDYTVSLEAQSNSEGQIFLRFLYNGKENAERDYYLWEIGKEVGMSQVRREVGWATETVGKPVPVKIDLNQWQTIEIKIHGDRIRCSVNNVLVHDISIKKMPFITSVATLDKSNNEIIVKMVNISKDEQETNIKLSGVPAVASRGIQIVLTSTDIQGENSFEDPLNIAPITSEFEGAGTDFTYLVPGYSVVILKFKIIS